ncbi:hypothetical protein OG511_42535 [Streptomyces sp. NBC_01453]|uniref:hypothetical protein n=1 Tax=Streptomyces sp. NBC_01453 TaxID=2903873 RepID=UPI002E2A2BA1|nr:hypothetical protein [Streptomyces sp. NBC_01453]
MLKQHQQRPKTRMLKPHQECTAHHMLKQHQKAAPGASFENRIRKSTEPETGMPCTNRRPIKPRTRSTGETFTGKLRRRPTATARCGERSELRLNVDEVPGSSYCSLPVAAASVSAPVVTRRSAASAGS